MPFVLGPDGSVRIPHDNNCADETERLTLGVLGLTRHVEPKQARAIRHKIKRIDMRWMSLDCNYASIAPPFARK